MTIRRESGFTLVELLIAMTIFAVGLISLAGMQIVAIKTNATAHTLTTASALAEGILEEILARDASHDDFADNPSDKEWDFDPDESTSQLTRELAGAGTYSAFYSIAVHPANADLRTIEVRVVGPNRNVTLTGFKNVGG